MRKPIITVISASLIVWAGQVAPALDATWEYAVRVSATVETAPPQIRLVWPQDTWTLPDSYAVYRKLQHAATWGEPIELPGSATRYTDTNVTVGGAYEYQIVKQTATYAGYGYIFAGLNSPLVENRGKVILMVDKTYAAQLASELFRLEQDMVGDGWSVLRHEVGRNETVSNVKALILADYKADPSHVKALFLFGHVPVPYSGNIIPDGHYPDHLGAWPADAYYGDMDGKWTDHTVKSLFATDPRNRNVPGDGKFDQSDLPSSVELEVGRVDLANMPGRISIDGPGTFPSELALLRQYLNKDHNFRHGLAPVPRRAVLQDDFGFRGGEAFAASGYRNLAPFFGADNVLTLTNQGEWLPTLAARSFLWAYGCGAGSYTSVGGLGHTGCYNDATTLELVRADPKAVFTMLFGSWLGDWDTEDNLMRAVLAAPSAGLTAAWSGRPHWFFHHMALGENIGYCARLTQNNGPRGLYKTQINSAAGQVHVALMGDPTLRMHIVAPPSEVMLAGSTLNWQPSPDQVEGYHVYRAQAARGSFQRLTPALLKETTFEDPDGPGAGAVYMVRAVKLESTPSGTYFNPSQGILAESKDPTPIVDSNPGQPAEMAVSLVSPSGADGEDSGNRVPSHPTPISGTRAGQANIGSGLRQH